MKKIQYRKLQVEVGMMEMKNLTNYNKKLNSKCNRNKKTPLTNYFEEDYWQFVAIP